MSVPVVLHAKHTHLFAGARLTAADGRFPANPGPSASSSATTRRPTPSCCPGEADGELHLTQWTRPARRPGHDIPAKRWRIRRVETDAAGAETGVVGTRMA
jgi:hypothetical protein